MKVSIVVPTYNESLRIGASLHKIEDYLNKNKFDYEIIVVDDGSTDKTALIVKKFKNSKVKLISYASNRGKGYAVKQGMLAATHDWILFTDADLATPMEELENFLKFQNYDVLIGSRAMKDSKILIHQPWYRELGGKIINFFVRFTALPGIKDTQCGFKLFRKAAAQAIFPKQTINGFGFDIEILYIARKKGFKIKELPIQWSNNPDTKVKPLKDGLRILIDLAKIRLNDLRGVYD